LIEGRGRADGGPIEPFFVEEESEAEAEEDKGVPFTRLLFPRVTFEFDIVSSDLFFTMPMSPLTLMLLASSEDIADGGRDPANGVAVKTLESLR
jgi:hypothetical protein